MNPVDLANHAAQQSDRWLFIAVLIMLGIFAVAVMRYFVRQHERLIDDHAKARDTYQQSLREIVAEQNKTGKELAAVLASNTVAIQQNSEALADCTAELRACREARA